MNISSLGSGKRELLTISRSDFSFVLKFKELSVMLNEFADAVKVSERSLGRDETLRQASHIQKLFTRYCQILPSNLIFSVQLLSFFVFFLQWKAGESISDHCLKRGK